MQDQRDLICSVEFQEVIHTTLRVNDTLGDPLTVKRPEELGQVVVLQQKWSCR